MEGFNKAIFDLEVKDEKHPCTVIYKLEDQTKILI